MITDARRDQNAAAMQRRRAKMHEQKICVNGWSHGAAYKGGRCKPCWDRKEDAEAMRLKRPDLAILRHLKQCHVCSFPQTGVFVAACDHGRRLGRAWAAWLDKQRVVVA